MQLRGVVVHGKKEARTLGYPTANIEYFSSEQPESGVWTCWVTVDEKLYQGLAVVDMWQLANGCPSLEVHILDFSQEVYGKQVEVALGERLRALAKFEGLEKLKQQIEEDVKRGREWFAKQ